MSVSRGALVVAALGALLGLSRANEPVLQDPLDRSAGLIGLLPLPEVFGESVCVPFEAKPIDLFAGAGSAAPSGEIRVTKPWRFPPEGGCEGLEVRVFRGSGAPEVLPTLEYSYEESAAIVLERVAGRARIALTTGDAWIALPDSSRFLPAERLLAEGRLTYLREGAAAQLRRTPALDAPRLTITLGEDKEPLVEVLESRTIGGALWVRVTLLEENVCDGEPTGLKPDTAWVPFHGVDRRPTVWYYSRGY